MQDQEFSRKDAEVIFQSKEARTLLSIMQKDGGVGLRQASEAMRCGDYEKAVSILKPLLNAPNSEQLLQELNKKLGRS